jgi:hypothetical protein
MITPTTKSTGTGDAALVVVGAGVDDALPNAGVELLRLLVVWLGDTQPPIVAPSTAPIITPPNALRRLMACSLVRPVRLETCVIAFPFQRVTTRRKKCGVHQVVRCENDSSGCRYGESLQPAMVYRP